MEPDEDRFDDEEDIPLPPVVRVPPPRPHSDALMEAASKMSGSEWLGRYLIIMARAFDEGMALLGRENSPQWRLCRGEAAPLLFQWGSEPVYFVSAVVEGRAERYAWILKDHDANTRLPWDESVAAVQQLETYRACDDMDVVKCEIKRRSWFGGNQVLLGIQSAHYNHSLRTHTYIFHTAPHYYYTAKETGRLVEPYLVCVWLSSLEDNHCRLKAVVRGECAWDLRERVLLWERVVQRWDEYYPLDPKRVENRK